MTADRALPRLQSAALRYGVRLRCAHGADEDGRERSCSRVGADDYFDGVTMRHCKQRKKYLQPVLKVPAAASLLKIYALRLH